MFCTIILIYLLCVYGLFKLVQKLLTIIKMLIPIILLTVNSQQISNYVYNCKCLYSLSFRYVK